ncbi:MAG: DUF3078 domain-containing protein [Bacteroidales bacterium]|nr:DUF3078 domain-containing protein [Bacteroidales bacterium]
MKKLLLVLMMMVPVMIFSQEPAPKKWAVAGISSLNLNQASFSYWTAGGTNSLAFSALGKYSANYKQNKFSWNNNLNLMYGMVKNQGESLKKSEDLIELISVAGLDLNPKWSVTGYMSFRTQFANAWDKDNDSIKVSQLLSPGYLTLSPSVRFKPNDNFYILISPATAKFTFVTNQDLADKGSFGVTPAEYDSVGNQWVKVTDGDNMLLYLGPFLEAYYKKTVVKNLTYETRFNVLYTLLNRDNLEGYDADVSWENYLNYSIAKYFNISLLLHLVYLPGQPAIKFDNYEGAVRVKAIPNRHIQIKETIGFGISYIFPAEKK